MTSTFSQIINSSNKKKRVLSEEQFQRYGGKKWVVLPHYLDIQEHVDRNLPIWDDLVPLLTRRMNSAHEMSDAMGLCCDFFTKSFAPSGFFEETLPAIQRLALRLPELFPKDKPITLLLPQIDQEVTLTQEQCGCLLANSFMGTLWINPAWYSQYQFPLLDLQNLFSSTVGPTVGILKSIIHYFHRITTQMPTGKVTFHRQVLQADQVPDWAHSDKVIRSIVAADPSAKIEDFAGPALHANFANKIIGGGVLTGGCLQEEILFAIKPECLVSMLFCTKMEDNESLLITGAERYSNYKGYGHRFRWDGDHCDTNLRDSDGRLQVTIASMDAVDNPRMQYNKEMIERDLNKVYCACFDCGFTPPFATGNWGCGAFGGDKSLKLLQQLVAASQAGRDVVFHPFAQNYNGKSMEEWIRLLNEMITLHHLTVGDVYRSVLCVEEVKPSSTGQNLFERLIQMLQLSERRMTQRI